MKRLRAIGIFFITCSAICSLIAYERYKTAESTARAVAEVLDGIDFVSVDFPAVTIVAALIGLTLLVAGIKCVIDSFRESP